MTQPLYSNLGFEQPLELSKGSDFFIEFNVYADNAGTPLDLTGHEMKAVVQSKTSTEDVFPFDFTDAVFDATGIVRAKLAASVTQQLVANDKKMSVAGYRWACEIRDPDGNILPYCYGDVFVRSNAVIWS